jgi:2-epi-5-epi-valiolone 7-phosphate 2-epimerase
MSAIKIGICEWALPIGGPCGLRLAAELGLQGVEVELKDHVRGFPLSKDFIQKYYEEEKSKSGIEIPSIALNELDSHCMTGLEKSDETKVALLTIQKGLDVARRMKIGLVQVP